MEAVIKSPLISDEIVLWPSRGKPAASELELVIACTKSDNVDMPETRVDVADANENSQLVSDVVTAEEPGLEEFQPSSKFSETRLKQLEEESSKTGYQQGFLKGEIDAKAQYSEALCLLYEAVGAIKALELQVIQRTEGVIGSIVFEAVSKIVGTQLCTEEGRKEVISRAIQTVKSSDLIKIKVCPQDLANLRSDLDPEIVNLPWEADNSLGLGGCIVELLEGSIDASIETQFRIFAQSIKEAAGHVE